MGNSFQTIGAIGLALGIFVMSASAKEGGAPEKTASVEGITEYRYENGLRVLLFPDSTKPTVTVNITYFVGSRLEGRGETGMAHLLEHMLFKGTEKHKNIWKLLEDHGAQFNGTTWFDRTNYFETLPADPENFEFGLRMEADRMVNSLILKSDLDTEMTVVRNEFESGENQPISILTERIMSAAFLWHNYGKSTIGSRSDIERVPIENLRAFYKKYYRPDNAMLVIAGSFKPEKALELVGKYFAPIPKPQTPIDNTYTIEPVQDGPRHVELRRVGDLAAAAMTYHICAGSHPDYPAIEVMLNVLADEPSGRLYQALVSSGMTASVSADAYRLREPGVVQFLTTVRTDQPVEPALEKMKSVVEGLGETEIKKEEVERAKNRILKNLELSMKNVQRLGVELSEWAAAGDWRLIFLYRDAIEKITPQDVSRVAKLYLKASNRTSGIFYPTKEPDRAAIPETPDVWAMVKEYKGKAALAEGTSFDPTPDNIESRIQRSELKGGIKLALLPKQTRGESVRALLTLHIGSEADLKGRRTISSLVPSMLMRGTEKRNYQQIRDELDRLKARVSLSAGSRLGSVSASIETDKAHLIETIGLVGEMLQKPAFPSEEFEIEKREQLAELEQQISDPQALGFLNVFRRLNPWSKDDVRYIPTIAESIEMLKAAKIEDLKKFHGELYGASRAEMSVVGAFDEPALKQAVEKTFGSWKSPKPFQRVEARFRGDIASSEEVIQTPDKQMALIGSGINLEIKDDDPEYPALNLANYVFGASAKSRLLDRLRQKEGLSYGAFSFLQANSLDRASALGAGAICAPQNADKAMDGLLDEFRRLVNEPFTEEELEDAKESWALQMENRLAEDGYLTSEMNQGLYIGRTFAFHKNLLAKTAALKPAEIQAALKKHVKLGNLVRVKAGDLRTKEAGN